jgi:probable rRNA maturation factor
MPGRRGGSVRLRQGSPPRLAVEVVTSGDARAPGLSRWLESVAPARVRGAMTVAIVPDSRVRALNRRYRRKDRPTDVLSFPTDEPGQLGDVVIAAGVARRQAALAGHSIGTELRVLALHGLLHLLGYDHETDDGEMRRVERRLRREGGLREGLIERTRNAGARIEPAGSGGVSARYPGRRGGPV